jgi:hypothetical protein
VGTIIPHEALTGCDRVGLDHLFDGLAKVVAISREERAGGLSPSQAVAHSAKSAILGSSGLVPCFGMAPRRSMTAWLGPMARIRSTRARTSA